MKGFFANLRKIFAKAREWENPFYEEPDEERDMMEFRFVAFMVAVCLFYSGADAILRWDSRSLLGFISMFIFLTGVVFFLGAQPFKENHGRYPWQEKD
jgi:hypothetical protein